jgi:siroheme synthase
VQRGEFVVYLLAGDPLARRDMSQLLMSLQAAGIVYDVVLGVIDQRAGFF